MKKSLHLLLVISLTITTGLASCFSAAAYNNDYTGKEFHFKLVKDAINYDEMIVMFIEGATSGKDMYDISVFWGPELNLTSKGCDGSYLTLDAKPFNGTFDTTAVSIRCASSGSYTLCFSNAGSFSSTLPIQLIDRYTNTLVNLMTQQAYTFQVDLAVSASYGDNRFGIVIGAMPVSTPTTTTTEPVSTTPTPTPAPEPTPTPAPEETQLLATLVVYPTVTRDLVTVRSDVKIISTSKIQVYDPKGKLVLTVNTPLWNNKEAVIDLGKLPNKNYTIIVTIGQQKPVINRCIKI